MLAKSCLAFLIFTCSSVHSFNFFRSNSTTNLRDDRDDCNHQGGVLEGMSGSICSHEGYGEVNYPNVYQRNWVISIPAGTKIEFEFEESFDVEYSSSCGYDSVKITPAYISGYSGTPRTLCGNNLKLDQRKFVIDGKLFKNVNVRFISDSTAERYGFKLNWRVINFKPVNCESSGLQTGDTGLIQPPAQISDSIFCKWNIEVKWWEEIVVIVNKDFSMAENDVLSINQVQYSSGDSKPSAKLFFDENELEITFMQNKPFDEASIFGINWSKVEPSEFNECDSKSIQTGSSGVLQSKNYPNNYNNDLNCQWFIEVDEDSIIVIEFPENLKFEENQVDCEFDYLLITDPLSDDETKICENGVNKVYSSGNRLFVRFVTDELKVDSGFVLNWSALLLPVKTDEDFAEYLDEENDLSLEGIKNQCDSEILQTGESGEILIAAGQEGFACYWRIEVEPGYLIRYQVSSDDSGSVKNLFASSDDDFNITQNHSDLFDDFGWTFCGSLISANNYINFKYITNENSTGLKIKWEAIEDHDLSFTPECYDQIVVADNGTVAGAVSKTDVDKSCFIRILAPRNQRIVVSFKVLDIRSGRFKFLDGGEKSISQSLFSGHYNSIILSPWSQKYLEALRNEGSGIWLDENRIKLDSSSLTLMTEPGFVGRFEFDFSSVESFQNW